MSWKVTISRQANKQATKLPRKVRDTLQALLGEIERSGPVRGDWPNYSKLSGDRHHCHLKKGRPCYVAV
ncbi:MAG: cytotoxic translational repressor of toxin-antitoxin stability system [Desulfuromonadales bacterium]|nr:cytotoxic translational repressor of toxin-antitoxin stability system [Desulfuromonadales bacterium]